MKHTTSAAANARRRPASTPVEGIAGRWPAGYRDGKRRPRGSFLRQRPSETQQERSARAPAFLVDTGAVYTVLPRSVWSRLRLRPHRTVEFTLADGGVIARPVSACWIEVEGTSAPSPVVLGEADDGPLLGAVTLETLGLMVNPLSRELVPMRLTLAPLPV